nr:DUF2970 domain-containing protein [Polaromonas sp. UBA4122]
MSMAETPAKKSIWRTAKVVAWSFVGLRGRGAYDEDAKNLSLIHIIVVGLVAILVFVASLVFLVNWVVAH